MTTKIAAPVFKSYQPHPLMTLWPESGSDDLNSMKEDIRKRGVQQKLKIWRDPKGREFLIDGRTRQTAAEEVFNEIVSSSETPPARVESLAGTLIQPEVEVFAGAEADVFAYIQMTHCRKHYSAGQKAALGVRIHYYEYKNSHKGKLPDIATETGEADGKTAQELAARFGCNEYYIRICRQLYREAPDLLDAVAANVMSPKRAEGEMMKRKAAKVNGVNLGDDSTPEEPAASSDGREDAGAELTDDDGNPVPESCKDAFEVVALFNQLAQAAKRMKKDMKRLSESAGGAFVEIASFNAVINSALSHISSARPSRICNRCQGKKKVNRWDCTRCKASGYVCAAVEKAEAEELKLKAEAEAEEAAKKAAASEPAAE